MTCAYVNLCKGFKRAYIPAKKKMTKLYMDITTYLHAAIRYELQLNLAYIQLVVYLQFSTLTKFDLFIGYIKSAYRNS